MANREGEVLSLRPVPVIGKGNFGINNKKVLGEIIPLFKKVAAEMKLKVIDHYTALDGHPEVFPDRVHPNDDGAVLMAKAVFAALGKK